MRPSWLNLWWVSVMLGAPSAAVALTWSVTDPVPSPAPQNLAPIAQDWLAGDLTSGRWSRPVVGPIDVRAMTQAGPGGTIYAASVFESDHAGAVAIRLRTNAAFRVWLDGRLVGGSTQAPHWKATPTALPAAIEPGAHRLLVELRPAWGRSAGLAAAVTTPGGTTIDSKPLIQAPPREATSPSAPIAISAVEIPSSTRPSQAWRQPTNTRPKAIAAPAIPDSDGLRAIPRWPDADWVLLSDARHWVLDTRQQARRVVGRVNAVAGLAPARDFLRGFDAVAILGPDGAESASLEAIQVGTLFTATRIDAPRPDVLRLGATRLRSAPVPTWRMAITLEAPRGWALVRRARGVGGARIVDDIAGRRQWLYQAEAVAAGAATLRVSRADGAAEFVRIARAALRDHLRPYAGQPRCADMVDSDPLTRAVACARDGSELLFVRGAGRPALKGPVDLQDFDAIAQTMPGWAASGLALDGTVTEGRGIETRQVELTPTQPTLPVIPLAGPCGAQPVANIGTLQTEITVRLTGVVVEPPRSRRTTAGPLTQIQHVERTATGWQAVHRLSWTDIDDVSPARLFDACRRLARP